MVPVRCSSRARMGRSGRRTRSEPGSTIQEWAPGRPSWPRWGGARHAQLAAMGRAEYPYATDEEAVAAFELLSVTEGIVPALEPAHAIAWLAREAGRSVPSGATVLVTLSGRGDKDAAQVAERLTGEQ